MPTKDHNVTAKIPAIDQERAQLIEEAGGRLEPIAPIGACVYGLDLRADPPPETVLKALEWEMAQRGFLVFKDQGQLSPEELIAASVWWGGRAMASTHGVHPATPQFNRHIFRLSNDPQQGIRGVGPLFHNDGAFCEAPFSHVAYHIIEAPERGGGTLFAHQAAAYDALPAKTQDYWSRLTSVNATSGVLHPVVHTHPISGQKCVWLHLGMTGAVIEVNPNGNSFRTLEAEELRSLCESYHRLLHEGIEAGYTLCYEYQPGDCIFIDNYAVAHRASREAHETADARGLRILHRATVKAPFDRFPPGFGLPQTLPIAGDNPFGSGVWHAGGIGFRWDDRAAMQN